VFGGLAISEFLGNLQHSQTLTGLRRGAKGSMEKGNGIRTGWRETGKKGEGR